MRLHASFPLVLCFIAAVATLTTAESFNLYVDCAVGNDENTCGSLEEPCKSLSVALSICNGSNGTALSQYHSDEEAEVDEGVRSCNITILPSICIIQDTETMLVPENCTITGLMGSEYTVLQLEPLTVRDVGFHIPNGRNVRFEGIGFYYNSSRYSKLIFVEEVPILARFAIVDCVFTCMGNGSVLSTVPRAPEEPSIINFRHSENNGEVHINGTSFSGHLVSLCIDGAGDILLSNCVFEHNQVRLMDLIAASMTISECSLLNNSDASVMITMDGESRIALQQSVVSYNRAQSLIYLGDVSTPTMQSRVALLNSTFESNVASYCVNGVSLDVLVIGSKFMHNELTMLYVSNSNVYMQDSSVEYTNSNKSSVTVSIHDDGLSTAPFYSLMIVGCSFEENSATTSGGAVRASAFAKKLNVYIQDSMFSTNHANNGGALMIDGNCIVQLFNNTFSDNTADERGAAIFCTSAAGNATVELKNGNVFVENSTYVDDDDGESSASFLIYNDPNHACGIYCTESMEAMCTTGAAEYPPAGFTITILTLFAMIAIVATVSFSAYCYVWVKDVKRFSDYEVVDPE